ncbi:MAG TPA: MlaA family lipoprotein [Kiloniellales bacterium]|nr:MlaA family lipoprotein [Kiloniellales bacterium]
MLLLPALAVALPGGEPQAETLSEGAFEEEGDPLEGINRLTHRFNLWAESEFFEPFFDVYEDRLSAPTRQGLHNALRNLQEPIIAVTSGLAGDLDNATVASLRFGINTTVGLLGTRDVAGEMLLESRPTDLTYTFCRYGMTDGPYLVLPLMGGTSVRKLSGRSVTQITGFGLFGPLFVPLYPATQATSHVDRRAATELLLGGALDAYARERAVARQQEAVACGEDPTQSAFYRQLGVEEAFPPLAVHSSGEDSR